jgi:hypothetical protein
VKLVGIEKLGILKTDKLMICWESYNPHKASNACNAGFIVRLLYGNFAFVSNRSHPGWNYLARFGMNSYILRRPQHPRRLMLITINTFISPPPLRIGMTPFKNPQIPPHRLS